MAIQNIPPGLNALNISPTDVATLAMSTAQTWNIQLDPSAYLLTGPLRAGTWPRMDGNRYGNQPNVGLAAG